MGMEEDSYEAVVIIRRSSICLKSLSAKALPPVDLFDTLKIPSRSIVFDFAH